MTVEVQVAANMSQASVEALSLARLEPAWMLELRMRAWRFFEEIPWPTGNEETWRRTKLTGFKLEDYTPLVGAGTPAALPDEVTKALAEVDSVGETRLRRRRAARTTGWIPSSRPRA